MLADDATSSSGDDEKIFDIGLVLILVRVNAPCHVRVRMTSMALVTVVVLFAGSNIHMAIQSDFHL